MDQRNLPLFNGYYADVNGDHKNAFDGDLDLSIDRRDGLQQRFLSSKALEMLEESRWARFGFFNYSAPDPWMHDIHDLIEWCKDHDLENEQPDQLKDIIKLDAKSRLERVRYVFEATGRLKEFPAEPNVLSNCCMLILSNLRVPASSALHYKSSSSNPAWLAFASQFITVAMKKYANIISSVSLEIPNLRLCMLFTDVPRLRNLRELTIMCCGLTTPNLEEISELGPNIVILKLALHMNVDVKVVVKMLNGLAKVEEFHYKIAPKKQVDLLNYIFSEPVGIKRLKKVIPLDFDHSKSPEHIVYSGTEHVSTAIIVSGQVNLKSTFPLLTDLTLVGPLVKLPWLKENLVQHKLVSLTLINVTWNHTKELCKKVPDLKFLKLHNIHGLVDLDLVFKSLTGLVSFIHHSDKSQFLGFKKNAKSDGFVQTRLQNLGELQRFEANFDFCSMHVDTMTRLFKAPKISKIKLSNYEFNPEEIDELAGMGQEANQTLTSFFLLDLNMEPGSEDEKKSFMTWLAIRLFKCSSLANANISTVGDEGIPHVNDWPALRLAKIYYLHTKHLSK